MILTRESERAEYHRNGYKGAIKQATVTSYPPISLYPSPLPISPIVITLRSASAPTKKHALAQQLSRALFARLIPPNVASGRYSSTQSTGRARAISPPLSNNKRNVKRIANSRARFSSGWKRFNKRTRAVALSEGAYKYIRLLSNSARNREREKYIYIYRDEREKETTGCRYIGETVKGGGGKGADVVEREAKHVAARAASRAPRN